MSNFAFKFWMFFFKTCFTIDSVCKWGLINFDLLTEYLFPIISL